MDLKPCPFCGKMPHFTEGSARGEGYHCWYWCDCGIQADPYKSAKEAIEAWNRRALPPEPRTCETCGQYPCVNYLRDPEMCIRMSHWTPRATQSANVEMIEATRKEVQEAHDYMMDGMSSYKWQQAYGHICRAISIIDSMVGKTGKYTEDPETCQCDYHKACRADEIM